MFFYFDKVEFNNSLLYFCFYYSILSTDFENMNFRVTTLNIKVVILIMSLFSCKRQTDYYPIEVEEATVKAEPLDSLDFTSDDYLVNINTTANANFFGENNTQLIQNIAGSNYSYCHPDVLYFPEGKEGFKFWMVFTPYFGVLGTNHLSERYENPTVVVSNDGFNWYNPEGIINPLQSATSVNENMELWKKGEKHGFWSDVDWLYFNGMFQLFFRGSYITTEAYSKRGRVSVNNREKLKIEAKRRIVSQYSKNGINWSKFEICYSSNKPHSSEDNLILSPAFINVNNSFLSYEVSNNTGPHAFKGKENSYVLQRKSNDGINFSSFKQCKIVNFLNKPWLDYNKEFSPWHIDATYVDGYYFLLVNIGPVLKNTGEMLYLAYSKDGINFSVLKRALVENNGYRSCIFPMSVSDDDIEFGSIVAFKSGEFKYFNFTINKEKLNTTF